MVGRRPDWAILKKWLSVRDGTSGPDPGKPTNVVSKVQGGSMLHIKMQETVYHPGFYRVALAVNSRAELPPDPRG